MRKGRQGLSLRLSGDPNVLLRIEDVAGPLGANVPSILTDLLELASYVYAADQAVSRGGRAGRGAGMDWRRRFHFVVPVRHPGQWSTPVIVKALSDALSFLTEDSYFFEFEPIIDPPPFQAYLDLRAAPSKNEPADEVVLFSGGMDSLGGAIERLRAGRRVVLVSHRASTKLLEHQRLLAAELLRRYPGQVLHIPVQVHRLGGPAAEYTQRSRSFLFASLAAVVGHLRKCDRFLFCDNGVVSLNLPLGGQVVGARASRTTHPRVLGGMQRFLSALLASPIAIENPLSWRTRTDVVASIRDAGHADLLRHTVSCSRVHAMTTLHTHCGTCFQCIDRRFATLAAGCAEHDPEEMYGVELLTGERATGEPTSMAGLYLRHQHDLDATTDRRLQSLYALEIGRTAKSFPGRSPDEVAQDLHALHRRQAAAVRKVLADGVRRHSEALVAGTLPSSCMLRVAVGAGDVAMAAASDPVERRGPVPQQSAIPGDCPELPAIRIAVDQDGTRARVQGVRTLIVGAGAELLARLAETFRADVVDCRAPEHFRYVGGKVLAGQFGIDEQALRRRVIRLRRDIRDGIEDHCDLPTRNDVVVQSRSRTGYRLNPQLRLIAMGEWPSDVTPRAPKSHES